AYLDEYLLNAQQRELDETTIAQTQSLLKQDEQLEKWQRQRHKQALENFINQIEIAPPIDDIYIEILSQLKETIKSADLSDVLFIARQLQIKRQWQLDIHFEQPQSLLLHAQKKLSYWRRELKS
ncbi:MAG: hypothetical protein KAI17_23995, partial [Thiotrichaceae bacterium]|nr:hypothetical protein [Thiotrichaceae bacterium]